MWAGESESQRSKYGEYHADQLKIKSHAISAVALGPKFSYEGMH